MADDKNTPFAVRMDNEEKEKLLDLIKESGKNNKEFMSVLMSAYQLNRAKIEIPDIAKDIDGLQALTQQINDYYVNIGKRIETVQSAKDLQFTKEVEVYKSRIDTLKLENEKLKSNLESITSAYDTTNNENEEYKKQLDQLQESLHDKNLIVEEYKGKNDMLLGQLKQFEKYPEELEAYKNLLSEQQGHNLKLKDSIKDKDFIINNLTKEVEKYVNEIKQIKEVNDIEKNKQEKEYNKQLQELQDKHKEKITHLQDMAQIEKEKALLVHEKECNRSIQEINNKLQDMKDIHNKQIEEYQAKYKELLQEMESMKKGSVET